MPEKTTEPISGELVMGPVSYPDVRAADPAVTVASALHAVQVALDRRDNGGDAGPAGDE
jgi:hypothetical protein